MKQLDPRAVWLFFLRSFLVWSFILIFFLFYPIILAIAVVPGTVILGAILLLWIIPSIVISVFLYVWARLSYRYYRYELAENVYREERGVIFKKYASIPYERIQNIDIYRGILTRLLGLSDLHIQTAGLSGGTQSGIRVSEGRLLGLSKEEAEKLRDELLTRVQQSKNQGL